MSNIIKSKHTANAYRHIFAKGNTNHVISYCDLARPLVRRCETPGGQREELQPGSAGWLGTGTEVGSEQIVTVSPH